jgi:hypothetical protein
MSFVLKGTGYEHNQDEHITFPNAYPETCNKYIERPMEIHGPDIT